ncbi:MAG: 4Fe-4S binding protein [Candidatus Hodarchaeales archaeon]|jgi:polyferredoxin
MLDSVPSPNELLPLDSPVPMILFWVITFLFCIILINAKLMSRKVSTAIYLITIFFGGVLLGGIPNAVMPIEYILIIIGVRGEVTYLFLVILVLCLLFYSSLLFGRIFCGFVCPLGALQELISKINFKSDLEGQKEAKYRVEISSQVSKKVRWIFIGVLFLLASIWSIVILPAFNPFSGFLFLKTFTLTLIITFISLVVICFVSIFFYRPWCRFLCPFGAGSSFVSQFTGIKYQRTDACTECGLCEKVCPTQEAMVDSKKGECYFCNRCIEICPHDAIEFDMV